MIKIAGALFFLLLTGCFMGKAQDTLPIDKFPIQVLGNFKELKPFILYLTGDGGWNSFSQQFCNDIYKEGYSIVALNSRRYFWEAKTPDRFINDLEEIISYYLKQSQVKEFCIVGYSFGADVGAFIPAMLSNNLKEKLHPMVLMSPGLSTDFEVKLMDLLGGPEVSRKYKILPELDQTTVPILCIFGEDEELEIKEYLKESGKITVKVLDGGHRYNFETQTLVDLIIDKIDPVRKN